MRLNRQRHDPTEVKAFGSNAPSLYFILDDPTSACKNERSSLDRITKSLFSKLAKETGLTKHYKASTYKFKTCIPYKCVYYNKELKSYVDRSPTLEDIHNLKDDTLQDIKATPMDILICSGKNAAICLGLMDPEGDYKELIGTFSKYNDTKVYFIDNLFGLSIATTEKRRRYVYSKLYGQLLRLSNHLKGEDVNDIENNLEYQTLSGFDLDSLRRLDNIYREEPKLVLDYETSGLNTFEKNFHLAGIGLCDLDGNNPVYIKFYDFANRKTPFNLVPQDCLDYLKGFFSRKEFVVFNMQYECSVTTSEAIGINFKLEKVEDVMMWLRCLAKGSSLKEACINRLGARNWSEDVRDWANCVENIIAMEKPTVTMKAQRSEIEWLRESGDSLFSLSDHYEEQYYVEALKEFKRLIKDGGKILNTISEASPEWLEKVTTYAKENSKKLRSKKEKESILEEVKEYLLQEGITFEIGKQYFLKKKDLKLLSLISKIEGLCHKYFGEDLTDIGGGLKDYFIKLLDNHTVFTGASYADIPVEIVAPYCILDCKYTALLFHDVKKELEDKNLTKTAQYYVEQAYLGTVLSQNGIAWDDELASKLKVEYESIQIETLRSLILLPKIREVLDLSNQDVLTIKSTTKVDELKQVFNPMSSHKYEDESQRTSYRMSRAIMSDRFKVACMLYDVYEQANLLNDPDEIVSTYPIMYPMWKKLMKIEGTALRLSHVESLLDDWDEVRSCIKSAYQDKTARGCKEAGLEIQLYKTYSKGNMETLNKDDTERLYKVFSTVFQINPDDDTEWPEEFAALYLFKIYKKIEKSNGTYISGEIGRQSVEIIKNEEAENFCPLRIASYHERPKKNDETYIVRTGWGVCTATTKRWTASQHTVPKKTELMDLRTTRYSDGIKVHYDFSQAEVRVLAAMSGDKVLLDAFKSGLDVHRYNASIMWQKPMEEVSDAERGMAKGVTFSILYGSSIIEFASKYTRGNIREASGVIDSFFDNYKEVKRFINEMHHHGAKKGWVPSLMGDPIYVDTPYWFMLLPEDSQNRLIANPYDYDVVIGAFDRETEKKERSKLATCLRYSQNYCIQESSSVLSGLSIYQLQKHIEREKLSAKLECFTHDSCDMDTRIKHLLRIIELLPETCVNYIDREFGVPMKIDYEIGVSNNKMIEIQDAKVEGNQLTCHFEGEKDSLIEICDHLENNGVSFKYEIEKEKEGILSSELLFLTNSAYASALGKPYTKMSGNLIVGF